MHVHPSQPRLITETLLPPPSATAGGEVSACLRNLFKRRVRPTHFGTNEPLYVNRVTVRGYARAGDVDWKRLTKVERPRGINTPIDSDILMFPAGEQAQLLLPVTNLALETTDVRYAFRVLDDNDKVLVERSADITLAADQMTEIKVDFDTTQWRYGSYRYEYQLERIVESLGLATIDGHLGVYRPGQLAKAKDGEFMFGLQHTGDPLKDRNAALA